MHSWFDESRIREKRDKVFELTTASFSAGGNACVTSLNVLASGTYLVPNLFFPGLTMSFTPCHWGYVTVRFFFSSWECHFFFLFKWELCDTSATNKNNPEEEKSQIAKTYLSCFQSSQCPTKPLLFQEAQTKQGTAAIQIHPATAKFYPYSKTRRCKAVIAP